MKIGLVVSGIPPARIGGAEIQAWELAKRLAVEHAVTLFTRRNSKIHPENKEGVRIIYTTNLYGRLPWPLPYIVHICATTKAICRETNNLDVLLCFTTQPAGLIGTIVKRKTGLPFCVSVRGGDWYFVQPHLLGRMVLRKVFSKANHVLVQTPRIKEEIKRNYPFVEPIVVPNGVEADPRFASGNSLIFLGNLLWRKGVDVLLNAMKNHPEIPIVIGGDGPERKKLEKIAQKMNWIKFVGRIEAGKGRDFMVQNGKILVLPAVAGEGMPNVLLEAMSVGLPVVATDVAGVRDFVEDNVNGFVVPPADITALEKAILRLWNDNSLRQRMSTANKSKVISYSWDSVVEQYTRILSECIEKKDVNCRL